MTYPACYDCGRNIPPSIRHRRDVPTGWFSWQKVDLCPECDRKRRRTNLRTWAILIAITVGTCLCPVVIGILNELPRWIQEVIR